MCKICRKLTIKTPEPRQWLAPQTAFNYSKLTIETLEQGVKDVQS